MKSKKDVKVYGLSRNRYMELKYFCQQYYEWKEELKKLSYDLKSYALDGLPKGSNINKPTELLATQKANLERKIELVEQSAKKANTVIYQELLQNVVQGIPYRYLNVPYSRSHFFRLKSLFFSILDEKIT